MVYVLPDLIGVPNSLNFELVASPNLISVVISLSHAFTLASFTS